MKNKLLLTTAIASVAFAGSAFSETKIGGNLEQTFVATSEDGASSTRGFGAEHNISLSASKDLDNGLTASYGTVLEDGVADTHYLTVGTDTIKFSVARDNGANLSSSAIPYIGDVVGTAINQLGATTSNVQAETDVHNYEHMRVDFSAAGGTFTLGYAPQNSSTRPSDSGTSDAGESANSMIYSGNFGVDGLKVLAGIAKSDGQGANTQAKEKQIGASYNFGQFTVAAETANLKDSAAVGSVTERDTDSIAVTYAVNDNLSVGLYSITTEETASGTKDPQDEEIKMIQVGYNLGGLGLSFGYAEVDNISHDEGTDGEQFQIRTIQKF